MQFAEIREAYRECRMCQLHVRRSRIVWAEGGVAPIMFIGEAPGVEEDGCGRPFVGTSGKLLRRQLRDLDFKAGDFSISNVVRCRPPNNRTPKPEEAASCRPILDAEIHAGGAVLLVSLGNTALRSLLGPEVPGVSLLRGETYRLGRQVLFPTFHPSACLRRRETLELWRDDLAEVKRRLGHWRSGQMELALEVTNDLYGLETCADPLSLGSGVGSEE